MKIEKVTLPSSKYDAENKANVSDRNGKFLSRMKVESL